MLKQKSQLETIQVLRGVASLLVVLFHVTINAKAILKKDFCFDFFLFGGSGVDIFFVLSGFIITYTSSKGIGRFNKLLPFLRRRFVRIFPTYWIITGLFLLFQVAFPSFYKTPYYFDIENFLSTWFLVPGHIMVNGVSWTLSCELFFYALFSFAFLIPNRKIAFILFGLYILTIIAIALMGVNPEDYGKWTGLAAFPMNIEFFMGVLAAVLIPHLPRHLSLPMIISGSLLFLASALFFNQGIHLVPNGFNRVLLFGIPSFLIIAGLVRFELYSKINVHNWLLSLGEASYSLYLLHLPVIVAGIRAIAGFNWSNDFVLHTVLLLMTGVICFTSVLFFKWIERPLIDKLNKRTQKQP